MAPVNKYLYKRLKSFGYAFKGIWILLFSQVHARIHFLATLLVICLGCYYKVSHTEWLALILAVTIVWTAEAFNTAIELLSDRVSKDYHPLAGKAKDVAAGAVLLAATGALAIGLVIFVPRIF
jgi:diacylglycerol kinase (ATP)